MPFKGSKGIIMENILIMYIHFACGCGMTSAPGCIMLLFGLEEEEEEKEQYKYDTMYSN